MDNSLDREVNMVNELFKSPAVSAMEKIQEQVNELLNSPAASAMEKIQEQVNELIEFPAINNAMEKISKFQYGKALSPTLLKTFSFSSLNYAISRIPVLDEKEVEKIINNNEPPDFTVEEKQDIANCVDIVAEHSPNWEHRLESKAQSFMRDHPAAYAVLFSLILPILLNLFSSWLYDTIKVKANPSANAPIVQEISATEVIVIDRSHNYYYEVEVSSKNGNELKKGWVGKARLNAYLKEVEKAVSKS